MEPFSLLAGSLGIISAVSQSVKLLVHDINTIKNAPDVFADLKDQLTATEAIFVTLENACRMNQLESLTPDAKVSLQLSMKHCQTACEKFRTKLARWTKHSNDGIHWWDRVRVGLFAEATVEALCEQLNRGRSTMTAAVGTANLISTAALSATVESMRQELQSTEIKISQEIMQVDEEENVTEKALKKLEEKMSDTHCDCSELIEQLMDQHAALDDSRKLLKELHAGSLRLRQSITSVEVGNGGKASVGIINCEHISGDIDLAISDIKATNNGDAVVGIVQGLNLNSRPNW